MSNGYPPTNTPKPGSYSLYGSAYEAAYERAYQEARKAIVKLRKEKAAAEPDIAKRFELLGPREVERDAGSGEIITDPAGGNAPPKSKKKTPKPVDPFLPPRTAEQVDPRELKRTEEAYEYGWDHGWEDGLVDGAETDLNPPI